MLDRQALHQDAADNAELDKIRTALLRNEASYPGYAMDDDCLVLSRTSHHIPMLLQEFHSSNIGGYSGVLKTYHRLASELCWAGMKRDIEEMVGRCDICQRHQHMAMAPGGL